MKYYSDYFAATITTLGVALGAAIYVESDKFYCFPLIGIIFFILSQALSYIIRLIYPEFDNIPGWIKIILALLFLYIVLFKIDYINHLFGVMLRILNCHPL